MRQRPPKQKGNSKNNHLKETMRKIYRDNMARLYKDFEEAKDRCRAEIKEYKRINGLLDETNDVSNPNHKEPEI